MHARPVALVCLSSLVLLSLARGVRAEPLPYTGVNFAGGEFYDPNQVPEPEYGRNFVYPTEEQFRYFAGKGMNVFRLGFRWETLQPKASEPFRPAEIERLAGVVRAATDLGLTVILNPHNYARYYGEPVGGEKVPIEAFADFWGRLAAEMKDNDHVWFGLVNEPYGIPATEWLKAANAAIAAIRATGAENLILVPGTAYTGAHSWLADWYGGSNAEAMIGVIDPLDHYAYEVHQYLDDDSSGTKPEVVSATIGSERLAGFVQWCREHGKRAFLGEFGVAEGETGAAAIEDMLASMERDRDVWLGFAWWAAGAWWGDYMFNLEPKDGADRPQMAYLAPHLQPVAGE